MRTASRLATRPEARPALSPRVGDYSTSSTSRSAIESTTDNSCASVIDPMTLLTTRGRPLPAEARPIRAVLSWKKPTSSLLQRTQKIVVEPGLGQLGDHRRQHRMRALSAPQRFASPPPPPEPGPAVRRRWRTPPGSGHRPRSLVVPYPAQCSAVYPMSGSPSIESASSCE